MILSMTGFGRGSASLPGKTVNVEIKALNSKQLDLIIKVPGRYRCLEGQVRNLAMKAERGKVEVTVSMEHNSQEPVSPLNLELIRQYKKDIEEMDRELGLEPPADWHRVLLCMPDAMKGDDHSLTEEEQTKFMEAVEEAVASMTQFRIDEGRKLFDFFGEKIDNIRKLLLQVEPYEESRVSKIKSRIYEQLEKLSNVEIDNGRLEQELIYYIEKLDISEEKQRLRAHLDYFLQTLGPKDEIPSEPKGKKLGFIAQEMGREINTLGSKSNNAEMQIIVVKMKDELEQIKEQVLNVL